MYPNVGYSQTYGFHQALYTLSNYSRFCGNKRVCLSFGTLFKNHIWCETPVVMYCWIIGRDVLSFPSSTTTTNQLLLASIPPKKHESSPTEWTRWYLRLANFDSLVWTLMPAPTITCFSGSIPLIKILEEPTLVSRYHIVWVHKQCVNCSRRGL